MTSERASELFKLWVETLNLSHWRFHFHLDQKLDGPLARIEAEEHYNEARIYLDADKWPNADDQQLSEWIVHELLHAHLHALEIAALSATEGCSRDVNEMSARRLDAELERVVETLALSIVAMTDLVDSKSEQSAD